MGMNYPQKVWALGRAVAHNGPLANPRRWGSLPYELKNKRSIMPVLMDGKTITFGTVQRKHSHHRRAFIPNILYRPLYSRALDMQVWTCVSSSALREIDSFGGFDEYILKVSSKRLGNDPVTLMYKKKVLEVIQNKKSEQIERFDSLLTERYGKEYIAKITSNKG
jgi:ribosomal protein L28